MKIAISRHIFGSIRGYTTLAKSEDLSSEEIAKLETVSFGQTNESSYLSTLQTNPAFISRPLRSDKWAVTRVFQGELDDRNRITLLFISAVITIDDWLYSLKCDVNKLLDCPSLWQWNGEEKLSTFEMTIKDSREAPSPEIRQKVLSLLSAVEKYALQKNTTIVVKASDFDAEAFRWLNRVLPVSSKRVFSCVSRSLNDGLPFTLISMAEEGTFGNSRRTTIKWTPASIVENCPYTASLRQFWQVGSEPPFKFINSCKSLLVDMETELEPAPRKRIVRKRHIARFNRKLAVLLFICAAVVSLVTVITILTKRSQLSEDKVSSLINKANLFLIQNSLHKGFSTDSAARVNTIEHGRGLKYRVEVLMDRTNAASLEPIKSDLLKWIDSAEDTRSKYDALESCFKQFCENPPDVPPIVYPNAKSISSIDGLKQDIINIADEIEYLAQNYKLRREEIEGLVNRWHEGLTEFLQKIKGKVEKLTQSDLLKGPKPECYSEEQYNKYSHLKQNLENFKENESLTNAADSPIQEHQEIAETLIAKSDEAVTDCNSVLLKLDFFKKGAVVSFREADSILTEPNIADGNFMNFSNLRTAKSSLDGVAVNWPGKEGLEDTKSKYVNKYRDNFKRYLEINQDRVRKIGQPPDVNEMNKMLKEFKEVGEISKECNVPDINSSLQQLDALEEKVKSIISSIEPYPNSSEDGKLQSLPDDWKSSNKEMVEWGKLQDKVWEHIQALGIDPNEKRLKIKPQEPNERNYYSYIQVKRYVERDKRTAKLKKSLSKWESVNKLTIELGDLIIDCDKSLQSLNGPNIKQIVARKHLNSFISKRDSIKKRWRQRGGKNLSEETLNNNILQNEMLNKLNLKIGQLKQKLNY